MYNSNYSLDKRLQIRNFVVLNISNGNEHNQGKNLRMAVCGSNQPSRTEWECMAQAVANLASVNLYLEPGEALKVWFMKTIPR